ncbi:gamma-glutamyl-gamma-aminobutyrate hydrolase family protein [Oscillochloris sp. ZM17-4]|uniref:gamma-glutamyl-gamma-aminobutyrate hydrolase family protein n=1 Tax=Oscillochloris sp. ZM17-4 TaxID=2866714 RepID=UPI001C73DB7B|nr:gamma-glutamyl-gamma-aminobutyrate hydrolase family protein [Oscillochloris sp. ZM17-4]MBX0328950.1 gamma-glutamyl-gamma-aminobutyrate hydrolase family protein [Oscillochloris sp. ZM17-4]
MKPLIGISCGTFRDHAWCPPSYGHRQTYVDAILRAGGAPLLIPPVTDEATLRVLYERLDGILLAGGGDIAPSTYGDAPHEKLGLVDSARDDSELPLARWAIAEAKPVLGICRGIQVINVALGGTLYQDIPSQVSDSLRHTLSYEREDWTYMAHDISIDPNSRFAQLMGVQAMTINSLHHQSLKELAPGLQAVAWAPDGIVEAVEGQGDSFVVGVQCHPEALQASADPRWQALFLAFVESCAAYRPNSALAASLTHP